VIAVEGVAAARKVLIAAAIAFQHVVNPVFDSPKIEGRPQLIPFRRVIQNDIENHLDPGFVQFPHHGFEFTDLTAGGHARAVGFLGGEKGHGIITPVIAEHFASERVAHHQLVFIEFLHRHEFDGGDSEFPEVGDLLDNTQEGSRVSDAGGGVDGESPHMGFVDDGVGPADL